MLQIIPISNSRLVKQSDTAVTISTELADSISARSLTFIFVPGIGINIKNSGSKPIMSITIKLRS